MNLLAWIVLILVGGMFFIGLIRFALTLFAICFVFALINHGVIPVLNDTITLFQQLLHFLLGLLK